MRTTVALIIVIAYLVIAAVVAAFDLGSDTGSAILSGLLWPLAAVEGATVACLTTPRRNMATTSAFHLFDLPADPKAADGFYETEVVQAQEAE